MLPIHQSCMHARAQMTFNVYHFCDRMRQQTSPCTRNNQLKPNWSLGSRPATKQPNSTGNTWNLWRQRLKRVTKFSKRCGWLICWLIRHTQNNMCVTYANSQLQHIKQWTMSEKEEKTLHIQLEVRVKSVLNRTAGSLLRWRLQLRLALLPNILVASIFQWVHPWGFSGWSSQHPWGSMGCHITSSLTFQLSMPRNLNRRVSYVSGWNWTILDFPKIKNQRIQFAKLPSIVFRLCGLYSLVW